MRLSIDLKGQPLLLPTNIGGNAGMPGPPGPPAEINFLAAEAIPAFTLVTADGYIADSSNLAHRNRVIGMTLVATAIGFIGIAIVNDDVFNAAWAWSPGSKLFLNGTGLSVISPSTGFSQMIAVVRNPQTIIVNIAQAILL